jgi:hypothetical protein
MTDEMEVAIDTRIWDRDGEFLGVVTRLLGDYVEVRTEGGRSHWFPKATLHKDDGRTSADFAVRDILSHSVPTPDAYERSQYIQAESRTDEEEEQREQVLRELADQRRELHAGGGLPAANHTVGEPVEEELEEMEDEERGGDRASR